MNGRLAVSLAPVALAWLWTWRHLAGDWLTDPHYQYGWAVPPLFAILMWRTWNSASHCSCSAFRCGAVLAAAGVATWTLGEAIRLHDPLWRLTGALLNAGSVLITAAWLVMAGGLPLLRRMAFPLIFTWTAVPWPVPLELAVTQRLLEWITAGAVFCATALGIPALQRANVVELTSGPVGLNDACSGLQSLQAVLMASLFLGGLYRLSLARQLVLLAGGGAVALAGNLLRVLALVAMAHRGGPGALHQWHDMVGMCATAGIFLALLAIANSLQDERPASITSTGVLVVPPAAATASLVCALGFSAFGLRLATASEPHSRGPHWEVRPARLPTGWSAEPLAPTSQEYAMLRYDTCDVWKIRTNAGVNVWIYHFVWKRGGMPPLAFSHTPAMCLPWSGWQPEGAPVRESLRTTGGALPAVRYGFALDGVQTTAFQIVAVNGAPKHADFLQPNVPNRLARLFSTWRAPREVIDEEILLYVPLPAQDGAATELAARVLDTAVAALSAAHRP